MLSVLSRTPVALAALVALALGAFAAPAAAQLLYKSVDAAGRVVYSDQPPARGTLQKTMQLDTLPVSVVPGGSPAAASGGTAGVRTAPPPSAGVVLYTATWCGYCRAARAYLGSKGVGYREVDIDTPSGKTAFAQLGARGVPVLLAGGQTITGFTPQAYDAVFVARR